MKHLLHAFLLFLIYMPFAQSQAIDSGEEAGIEVDAVVEDIDFEQEIEDKVLSFVVDILNEVEESLADEEKEKIAEFLKEEILDEGIRDEDRDWDRGRDHEGSFMMALVPILGAIFIFGSPVAIVMVALYGSYRKKKLMHETINSYVESGKDIPPEVLSNLQASARPARSSLHSSVTLIGTGLGIGICFLLLGMEGLAAFGCIPLFIGLAQLLIWKLEHKDGKAAG